ncbi:MAG TPA: hypothetical protein PKE06_04715 [Flavilitoribacter sp.]|nr:hypothetical protein [Flavilitoribacter sp.]
MLAVSVLACNNAAQEKQEPGIDLDAYLSPVGDGVQSGGVQVIPIETMGKTFHVWTKRIGNNPTQKLLLLHGGPGATHEYFECLESFFPKEGIEFIYYDQLGIGGQYDTMDPEHMKQMATQVKDGTYLYCPNGSHMSMWDDQKTWMDGVISFIQVH